MAVATTGAPLANAAIARQQDGAPLITATHELEEQMRRIGFELIHLPKGGQGPQFEWLSAAKLHDSRNAFCTMNRRLIDY